MARPPLPWDPSDTRGIDADPSCLHHALALAYHFHLLKLVIIRQNRTDSNVKTLMLPRFTSPTAASAPGKRARLAPGCASQSVPTGASCCGQT